MMTAPETMPVSKSTMNTLMPSNAAHKNDERTG